MNKKSGTSKAAATKLVKSIRRKTRQTYSAEEKIRIVLAYMWWSIAITTEETAPNGQSEFLDKIRASLDNVSTMMSSADIAKATDLAAAKLSSFN